MIVRGLVVGLLAIGVCSCGAMTGDIDKPEFQLVTFHSDGSGFRTVPDGGDISYRVDDCYGWTLTFDKIDKQLEFEELLLLPDSAGQWLGANRSRIADDRMSASTTTTVSGQEGFAHRAWCVAEGDPAGEYKFVVSQDSKIVGEGTFNLVR